MKAERQKHEEGSEEAKHPSAISLQSDPLVILMHVSSCTHISYQGDDLPRSLGIYSSSHLLLALREVPNLHEWRVQALQVFLVILVHLHMPLPSHQMFPELPVPSSTSEASAAMLS